MGLLYYGRFKSNASYFLLSEWTIDSIWYIAQFMRVYINSVLSGRN